MKNLDNYKNADEAYRAFIEFCRKYTCGKFRFVNKGTPVGYAIEWLALKAQEARSKLVKVTADAALAAYLKRFDDSQDATLAIAERHDSRKRCGRRR